MNSQEILKMLENTKHNHNVLSFFLTSVYPFLNFY